MHRILVVDDEAPIRTALREILEMENYTVEEAEDGLSCMAKVKKKNYELVLLDYKMPKLDGAEVLERIRIVSPETSVIMISGHGDISSAVEAVKGGAFDFLTKPLDMNKVQIQVRNAINQSSLQAENKTIKRTLRHKGKIQEIIGNSEKIQVVKDEIAHVAPYNTRVLITGPNGSGKELVARWIHEQSDRKEGPFIEVNCAAIPNELIESDLFGHEKGAFTSAIKRKIGKFESANGGTIFLDEIGDMSLNAQAKVLRVLQENKITRVGGEKDIKVDVRVIAATNKDLEKEIKNGNFREDLFHRLKVVEIKVPPLNERRDDIPLLIEHFLNLFPKTQGLPQKNITDDAVEEMKKLDWTGNIRQLRNAVERLIIMTRGNTIGIDEVKRYVN